MKLIVEIDDEIYKTWRREGKYASHSYAQKIILNGTPLPKEHGRLKDVDAFISKVRADREHSAYSRSWTADDVLTALDNSYAPTIIEDGDGKDEDRRSL